MFPGVYVSFRCPVPSPRSAILVSSKKRETAMLTRHAEIRCQQRGIRPEVVDTLLAYGRRERRHGADVCFMDRDAHRRAERDLGRKTYARLSDRLRTYLVVGDDEQVITAAPRLRRIKV